LGLIAALGFPSASLQYLHLKIPLQFLSYDRVLRAGVLPAAALVVLVIGLSGIGYFASRAVPEVKVTVTRSSGFLSTSFYLYSAIYIMMFVVAVQV